MPIHVTLRTPENIPLHLALAGPATRARAFLFDTLLQLLLFVGAQLALYPMQTSYAMRNLSKALEIGLAFLILWGYHIFFETFRDGQTPGKKHAGIRVVSSTGRPLGFFASFSRNLMRAVDFLPALFLIGFFSMLADERQQRLGDRVAGSLVVRYESLQLPDAKVRT